MKNFLPPFFALLLCVGSLWWWTLGFSSFTVFSHTLAKAGPVPRPLPSLALADQDGRPLRPLAKKKYILLNFVYLDCPDVCHKINNRLEGIYHALQRDRVIPQQLELITVSFDLQHDDARKLKLYKKQLGEGLTGWSFAMPAGEAEEEFQGFLSAMGVWAQRVPHTQLINHSIYLFLIAPDGDIVKVIDPARMDDRAILRELETCMQP